MKKIIFLFLISFISLNALSFKDLSLKQQKILYKVYLMSKHTRYKWTMVAIAWKESLAGIAMTNIFDGGDRNAACGLFHTLISSVFNRHPEWLPSKFNKNKICTKLILNKRFAFQEAKAELDYWYKQFHGIWRKVWAAYNAGWKYNSKKGKKYAWDIAKRIKILRKTIKNKWEYGFCHIKNKNI